MSTDYTPHEIFKTIPFAPNYAVSDQGRVKRIRGGSNSTYAGRLLKPSYMPVGYTRVTLCTQGQKSEWLVHRLVAAVFLGPCPDGKQINHKNGIKDDNRLENLEYVTPLENIRHSWDVLGRNTRGENHGNSRLTRIEVLSIRQRVRNGETMYALAKEFKVSHVAIGKIIHRQLWKHI